MLLFTVGIYKEVKIIQQVSLMERYSWYLQRSSNNSAGFIVEALQLVFAKKLE